MTIFYNVLKNDIKKQAQKGTRTREEAEEIIASWMLAKNAKGEPLLSEEEGLDLLDYLDEVYGPKEEN